MIDLIQKANENLQAVRFAIVKESAKLLEGNLVDPNELRGLLVAEKIQQEELSRLISEDFMPTLARVA